MSVALIIIPPPRTPSSPQRPMHLCGPVPQVQLLNSAFTSLADAVLEEIGEGSHPSLKGLLIIQPLLLLGGRLLLQTSPPPQPSAVRLPLTTIVPLVGRGHACLSPALYQRYPCVMLAEELGCERAKMQADSTQLKSTVRAMEVRVQVGASEQRG